MALGSYPKLSEINAELGVTGKSLVECISLAGKTGVFTSQMDFAGFSMFSISPQSVSLTSNAYSGNFVKVVSSGIWVVDSASVPYWVTVMKNSGSSGELMIYDVAENGGTVSRSGDIKIMLQADNSVYKLFSITQDGI